MSEHTYVVAHEAWWWQWPDPARHPDEIRVQRESGAIWELTFRDAGAFTVELSVQGRGFRAFADRPDLWAELARSTTGSPNRPSLDEIRAILDRLGFVDTTPRVKPPDGESR